MIFIDTAGWIALMNRNDMLHSFACKVYQNIGKKKRITTDAVLLETCNAFCNGKKRSLAIIFMQQLEECKNLGIIEVIETSGKALQKGWEIFKIHLDKNWSLTDCIAFYVMKERKIRKALTSDHHFIQAGFEALLKQ